MNGTLDVRVETFGDWLRPKVWARGLGVVEFAKLVGARASTVSEWFNTARAPRPQACYRIAEVLELDLNDVLRKAGHPTLPAPEQDDNRRYVRRDDRGRFHGGTLAMDGGLQLVPMTADDYQMIAELRASARRLREEATHLDQQADAAEDFMRRRTQVPSPENSDAPVP